MGSRALLKTSSSQLYFAIELCAWIAAEFEWTSPNLIRDLAINDAFLDSPATRGPIAQVKLKMTLTKRTPQTDVDWANSGRRLNAQNLTDDAFLPKDYTLTLEKGNFPSPIYATLPQPPPSYAPHFALRLSFDPSPYPPLEQWKEIAGYGPSSNKVWEWTQFCSREFPQAQSQ